MRWRQWLVCCLLVPTGSALAQRVRGVVRDTVSGDPIPGAVVAALDSAGRTLARDLTNSTGRYGLAIPDGATRLRVVRIGFRPRDMALPAGAGDVRIDIALQPLPSLLQHVSVDESVECPRRGDRIQALGLWEQARAGLLASVAARESRPGDMRILEFRRLYDTSRQQLFWQQVRIGASHTARPFIPVQPAAAFAAHGYLLHHLTGTELAAPDADILLDDSFAATHCFSVADTDQAHAGDIGLAFEPAPGRDDHIVDVRGVLWLDRVHPALRSLEFRYTGLERAQSDADVGGHMDFRSMPNGVVFITRWSVDAIQGPGGFVPTMTGPSTSGRPPAGSDAREYERGRRGNRAPLLILRSGGEVVSAKWNDSTRWTASTASVSGRVAGRPGIDSAGVHVWLVGTTDTTRSDSAGRFHFDGLLPGPYRVAAAGPALAAYGIAQNAVHDSVSATLGGAAGGVVHLDSAAVAARGVCGRGARAMPATVLLVHVVDADRWNLPWDSVIVTWKKPSSRILGIPIPHEGRLGTATDAEGRAALCNLPPGEPLHLVIGPAWLPQDSTSLTMPRERPVVRVTRRVTGGLPH